MQLKFKLQQTPNTQPPLTQKIQKPSSLAFVHVNDPTQSRDKATLRKVRRHVMKDIGRSRRSGATRDPTAKKPLHQFVQMPTYWGDVQVCINVKRLFWTMDMLCAEFVSVAVVNPAIRAMQKIDQTPDQPPSWTDIERYTESIGVLRKYLMTDNRVSRDAAVGTMICLAMFDMRVGNLTSWSMHLEGIQRILNPSGGVEAMESAGPLRQALFLADVLGSLKLDITPKFSLPDHYFRLQVARLPYTQRLIDSLEQMHLSDPTLIAIIHNSLYHASQLAVVLNEYWADNPTKADLVIPVCSLAHHILSLPRGTLNTDEHATVTTQVWALAELVRNVTISLISIVIAQTSGDIATMLRQRTF
ncbi:hypothetical protein FLONG3_1964 [Fusarium longipes]|uniref:Uncharacterized protein n=1 Tax=Fusarium longipes TaxID=694270 RepID=A0A395T569_9HYPO|nr:hypothetical protein FLONG3_1964 [Fusarium longipes]